MPEDPDPAAERLTRILELTSQALELLDLAVGRAVRLPIRERERVREHLLPPRNHLRGSLELLRRRLGGEDSPRGL